MNNKKQKLIFDGVMIILMAAMLLVINYFDLSKLYVGFGLIPLVIFYYLGAYSERKFGSENKRAYVTNADE